MCLTGTDCAGGTGGGGVSKINDDVLQNILGRLPALTFASAACVSKSWNRVCSRFLTRPKLASALSLNPSLHVNTPLKNKFYFIFLIFNYFLFILYILLFKGFSYLNSLFFSSKISLDPYI